MNQKAQWAAGVVCICFVAVVWTLATVLKQIIFQDLNFNEPLILAYVCNACYIVHLPLHALGRGLGLVRRQPWRRRVGTGVGEQPADGSSVLEALRAGAVIAPIWFLAQWTYSKGVASTSVTSSTVISTTSVVWTLLVSVAFLGEHLTAAKIFGVAACMGGNVATLWGNDTQHGQHGHLSGDVLCLAAAVFYAVYTLILKRCASPSTSVALLFGALGAVVLTVGTPFVLLFGRSGLRSMTLKIFGLLVFNGLFDNVLSQYAWAKAVQWTSPTAATVGLSLTIPLSVVADIVRGASLTPWSFVAALLVVLGFMAVTLAAKPEELEECGDRGCDCEGEPGAASLAATGDSTAPADGSG